MKSLTLKLFALLLACSALQGCIMTQMLFNPGVRAAFIVPQEATPTASIIEDPTDFAGKHIAIVGSVTDVSTDFFVVDDAVRIKELGFPWSQNLSVGDEISVEGKLAATAFSKKLPILRYADEWRPRAFEPQ